MALVSFLSRHAALVLALGIFTGLILPGAASVLRPWLPLAVAGLLVLSIMQIGYGEFREQLSRPAVPVAVVVFMLCALPVLIWALLTVSGVPETLRTPIVLMAAAPPIMSAPAMALLLRLSVPLMLAIVAAATVAAPFVLGAVAEAFAASGMRIDPVNLALRLAAFIIGCFLAALVLRRLLGTSRIEKQKPVLDVISLIFFLTFAVAVMDGVSARLEQQTLYVISVLAISFLANLLLQIVGGAAFYSTGMQNALTIAYACGNRNLGLLLAVLPQTAAPDTLLFFAVAQVPIYTLPAVLLPMYNALLKRGA